MLENNQKMMVKMLVVIVDRDKTKKIMDIFREHHTHIVLATLGEGTAKSELLDVLGLDGTEKLVVATLLPDFVLTSLLEVLTQKLELTKPNHGIAFSLVLSGVASPITTMLSKEKIAQIDKGFEKEVAKMKNEVRHDLVVAVIDQGYSCEVMEAAGAVGATGGTVIHARRIGAESIVQFFGIPVQAEKEIVFLLVLHEQKKEVLQAINKRCGMRTEAQGMVFSMPVDSVAGLE